MNLIKTSFFTGISTFFTVAAGFIISKVLAIYVGPTGVAIVGQFQNFSLIAQALACGAINVGVTKYVADYNDDEQNKNATISTGFVINIVFSLAAGTIIFLGRDFLASYFLHDDKLSYAFLVFALVIIFFSLNVFFLSVINGEKRVKEYVLVSVISSSASLITVSLLTVYKGVLGALLALAIYPSIPFLFSCYIVLKRKWITISYIISNFSKKMIVKLFHYSIMTLTTVSATPLAQTIIRNAIAHQLSWRDAGYWQAVTKISDAYISIIITAISIYYLPRLAELKGSQQLKKEAIYCFKIVIPVVTIGAFLMYLLRGRITLILFTKEFFPALALYKFQLFGSVMRVAAWLFVYILMAKTWTKTFIAGEAISNLTYVILSYIALQYFGLVGVAAAFAMNYILYWLVMMVVVNKFIFTPSK